MAKRRDMIWYGLRFSFWLMIALFVISIFLYDNPEDPTTIIFGLLQSIIIIYVFVTSIIHLKRYRRKGFAITSLILSSILVLIILVAFIVGVVLSVIRQLASQPL